MRKRLRKKKDKQWIETLSYRHPLDVMVDILQGTKQVMNGS